MGYNHLTTGCCDISVVFGEVIVWSIFIFIKKFNLFFFPLFSAKYSIPIRLTVVLPGIISYFEFFSLILSSFPSSSINNAGCCWLIEMDFYSAPILFALCLREHKLFGGNISTTATKIMKRGQSLLHFFSTFLGLFFVSIKTLQLLACVCADEIPSRGFFFSFWIIKQKEKGPECCTGLISF